MSRPDPPAPRMSAVIPTYNRAALVVRAVESALAQTRPPDEIVVVNDGSTDDTAERLAPYLDRIRLVRQANGGVASARNHGVAAAAHPWIAFLDSDDVWDPRHLERMADALAATGGSARFYFADTDATFTEGDLTLWQASGFDAAPPWRLATDAGDWVMLPLQPTMIQSSVISREAFTAAGGFDRRLSLRDDTLLFLMLGLGGPACAVSGIGTVMSADDTTGRLTSVHDPLSRSFWHDTVVMYGAVLDQAPPEGVGPHRSELRARLALGHLRLAREAAARRAPLDVLTHTGRAILASPGHVGGRAARWAGRRLHLSGGASRTRG